MNGEEFIRMKQLRRTKYRWLARPLSDDWPEFPGATRKRAHLSRLSGPRHDRLSCEEFGQTAQVNRQHRQRERIADLGLAAQLDLADRRAMLLTLAKQGLDHLPNHLPHVISLV